jgi:hypothetical protein
VLERFHHVADEALGVNVRDARALVAAADHVADRVHQMRLAQADAAVDEQRVVSTARILGDLHGRGARQLVALALDEAREGEVGVQPAAEQRGQVLGLRTAALDSDSRRGHGGQRPRTDLQHDRRGRLGADGIDELGNPPDDVLIHPIDDEPVRREQPQGAAVLDRLERANPRVELRLRQFRLELSQTAPP